MNNTVRITVAGIAGSGKSRISYLIYKTLKENGFDVDIQPTLEEEVNDKRSLLIEMPYRVLDFGTLHNFHFTMQKNFEEAVENIKGKSRIIITDYQLPLREINREQNSRNRS